MSTPINNHQLSLGLSQRVSLTGLFPTQNGPESAGGIPLGAIRTFAFNFNSGAAADGQILSVTGNGALFSLLQGQYGGDGTTTFALPDVAGAAMIGSGTGTGLSTYVRGNEVGFATHALSTAELPASVGGSGETFDNRQPSLAITYLINTKGIGAGTAASLDFAGMVVPYAAGITPTGYLLADGRLLSTTEYPTLFAAIGHMYGGSGATFALPDLRGRTIVGAADPLSPGAAVGAEEATVAAANLPAAFGGTGASLDNLQPSLALNFLIARQGLTSSGNVPELAGGTPYIGEIVAYAGTVAPTGWSIANGQTLSAGQNQALFGFLGYTFGGSGNSFALPDLRNRAVVGTGADVSLGEVIGDSTLELTADDVSNHAPVLN